MVCPAARRPLFSMLREEKGNDKTTATTPREQEEGIATIRPTTTSPGVPSTVNNKHNTINSADEIAKALVQAARRQASARTVLTDDDDDDDSDVRVGGVGPTPTSKTTTAADRIATALLEAARRESSSSASASSTISSSSAPGLSTAAVTTTTSSSNQQETTASTFLLLSTAAEEEKVLVAASPTFEQAASSSSGRSTITAGATRREEEEDDGDNSSPMTAILPGVMLAPPNKNKKAKATMTTRATTGRRALSKVTDDPFLAQFLAAGKVWREILEQAPVEQLDRKTGQILHVFSSGKEAYTRYCSFSNKTTTTTTRTHKGKSSNPQHQIWRFCRALAGRPNHIFHGFYWRLKGSAMHPKIPSRPLFDASKGLQQPQRQLQQEQNYDSVKKHEPARRSPPPSLSLFLKTGRPCVSVLESSSLPSASSAFVPYPATTRDGGSLFKRFEYLEEQKKEEAKAADTSSSPSLLSFLSSNEDDDSAPSSKSSAAIVPPEQKKIRRSSTMGLGDILGRVPGQSSSSSSSLVRRISSSDY